VTPGTGRTALDMVESALAPLLASAEDRAEGRAQPVKKPGVAADAPETPHVVD